MQRELIEQAPKVDVYERIADAAGTLCLTDIAKHLGVKRKALLLWMSENRWIYHRTNSKRWLAYQPRLASGVLVHRIKTLGTDEHGDERVATQVRVTPKGLTALAKRVPRPSGGM
ncbi:Phage antirepressor protein KilAC domain protein [compost metagenome]